MKNFENFRILKERTETELAHLITTLGEKTKLRDACEYALIGSGKRFRPMIVLMVAEALGNNLNVMPAALAVEFFHTASLIADDLPCMDNDENRRNKPCLHKVYEESIAILASYTLISLGYEYIYKNAEEMKKQGPPHEKNSDRACVLALDVVTKAAGIHGATNGQFLDLFPPDYKIETIKKVIYQKTVTLFEISFVNGWVFGGGTFDRLDEVKSLAFHMGMAFQIGDDLQDYLQENKNTNIVNVLGLDVSLDLFRKEMKGFRQKLCDLSLNTENFQVMADLLESMTEGASTLQKA